MAANIYEILEHIVLNFQNRSFTMEDLKYSIAGAAAADAKAKAKAGGGIGWSSVPASTSYRRAALSSLESTAARPGSSAPDTDGDSRDSRHDEADVVIDIPQYPHPDYGESGILENDNRPPSALAAQIRDRERRGKPGRPNPNVNMIEVMRLSRVASLKRRAKNAARRADRMEEFEKTRLPVGGSGDSAHAHEMRRKTRKRKPRKSRKTKRR